MIQRAPVDLSPALHPDVAVIPLCWPSAAGGCGCGRRHVGRAIGKAPLAGWRSLADSLPGHSPVTAWSTDGHGQTYVASSGRVGFSSSTPIPTTHAAKPRCSGLPSGPVSLTRKGDHHLPGSGRPAACSAQLAELTLWLWSAQIMESPKKVPVGSRGQFVGWKNVEKGRTFSGTWLGAYDGKFGLLGDLDTALDRRLTFSLPTVLGNKLRAVRTGAQVDIKALGLVTGKSGNAYFDFQVMAEPDDILPSDDTVSTEDN
jgi:hypothetical protein